MQITNINVNHTDFFDWESKSCQIWNSLNSQYAREVYFWIFIMIILVTHVVPIFGIMVFPFKYLIFNMCVWYYQNEDRKNGTRKGVIASSKFMNFLATTLHGHKIIGTENLPNGPAMLVAYHSTMLLGPAYMYFEMMRRQTRPLCFSIHKKMEAYKPWEPANKAFNMRAFNRQQVIDFLKTGGHYLVAPGGMEEGRYSDNSYRIHFHNRSGYAAAALAANAAIVPVFTRNCQEGYWIPWYAKPFINGRFAPKKVPYLMTVGALPVKFTTIIGKPILYDPSMSPQEIAKKVEIEYQAFIDKFQPLPGNSWRALWERFYAKKLDQELIERLNSDL